MQVDGERIFTNKGPVMVQHCMASQSALVSLNVVRYMIYTKKKGKPPLVKSLPLTDTNLLLHMLRAHHQTMLWEAADKQVAPAIDITDYVWEMLLIAYHLW